MSAADIRIAEKRGEAEAAREALFDTVEEIKARLAPASIAHDAWEGARDKGVAVAEGAVETVKQRPALAAGVAAGAALVFARKPIINLLAGLFTDRDRKTKGRKSNLTNKE
jgi:hypothetical protein